MAFELSLYYISPGAGAAATIDMSTYVQFYTPTTAPYDTARVTEQVQIRLPAGLASARADLKELEDFFRRAKVCDELQLTPRPWILFAPDDTADPYAAQLFAGSIQPTETILTKGQSTFKVYDFVITWERDAVWTDWGGSGGGDPTSLLFYSSDDYDAGAYNHNSSTWYIYNSADQTTITDEVIDSTPNGVLVSFAGTTAKANIYHSRSTPAFTYVIGGVTYTNVTYDQMIDDPTGATHKVDAVTLNFETGAWTLVFVAAPDDTTDITMDYIYGYGNWIQIDGASGPTYTNNPYTLTGDVPALPVLQITNEGTDDWDDMWIGCYQANAVGGAFPQLWYEAEDADYSDSSGALQVNNSLSGSSEPTGGSQISWTVDTTEAIMLDWTLTAQNVRRMAGKWFAPIVRFGTVTADIPYVLFRWRVYTDNGAGVRSQLVFETDQYQPTANSKLLHQLGMVQITPWPIYQFSVADGGSSGVPSMHLVLTAQAVTTTKGLTIDAIQLMPTDFFCKIEYQAGSLAQGDVFTYDGYDQTAQAVLSGGTDSNRAITLLHDHPTIDPTRDQRWYFLWTDSGSYVAPFAWQLGTTMTYYARRRVI